MNPAQLQSLCDDIYFTRFISSKCLIKSQLEGEDTSIRTGRRPLSTKPGN
jgi:hypothetical protein